MSAAEQPAPSEALVVADRMGERGYRTHPLFPRAKNPVLNDWPNTASCDPDDHARWWPAGSERGLGWAMGVQRSGEFLVAVDVDVDKGGRDSLNRLGSESPWLVDLLMSGLFAQTGSGGFHFVIAVPPSVGAQLTNRARILPGIDIRSAGGQIAVFPSIHPNGRQYRWAEGHAPWDVDPVADERICDLLMRLAERPVVTPVPAAPRASDGDGPQAQVRAHERWEDWLPRWGWVCMRTLPNGDQLWKRPGKTDRGHSAVLHPNGVLVIFTTEIPPELERLAKPTAGGEGVSISLFAAIAAYEHGGDMSACGRWAYEQPWFERGSGSERALAKTLGPPPPPEAEAAEPQGTNSSSFLPTLDAAFWSARPWLAHIRQAAHAKGMPADAVLVNVLALYATTIPVAYLVPALLGSPASLNFIGCVVAPSGGGKTQAFRIAEDLVGEAPDKIRYGASPGSGEGIIKAYLDDVMEEDESGKMKPVKRQVLDGIHWYVDEGTGLTNSATGRDGTTILQVLCSAWSGERLGQENAKSETWRRLERDKYRLAVTICVQRKLAHEYFTEQMQALGVTGRGLWASAIDPEIPDEAPPDPGPLSLPLWGDRGFSSSILTFPSWVGPALRAEQVAVNRGELILDPFQSQHKLLRAKIAALFALAGGSMTVTDSDWELAGTLLSSSQALMAQLAAEHAYSLSVGRRATGLARAEIELASEDMKEARYVADMADKLVAKVLGNRDKRWGRSEIRKSFSSGQRHRFDAALDRALRDGRVMLDGGAVVPPK